MNKIDKAIEDIKWLHAGQEDKAGMPYWEHPVRVMMTMGARATEDERMTALFHDVLEDVPTMRTADLKRFGLSDAAIEAVELLTRDRETTSYNDYIYRIMSSGNALAIKVKLADARDNLRGNIPRLQERYIKTIALLQAIA